MLTISSGKTLKNFLQVEITLRRCLYEISVKLLDLENASCEVSIKLPERMGYRRKGRNGGSSAGNQPVPDEHFFPQCLKPSPATLRLIFVNSYID